MTTQELWATVCHPLPAVPYPAHRRRALMARIFIVLCALSVIGGALYGWNH